MKNAEEKILIVDDDNRNVFALSAVLRARGFSPVAVSAATDALDMLNHRDDVGIVLMDMMMPEMDGYTLIPEIRKNNKLAQLPLIAVTAQAMPGDKERCLAAGADEYLSKPIDVDKLQDILNRYLKQA